MYDSKKLKSKQLQEIHENIFGKSPKTIKQEIIKYTFFHAKFYVPNGLSFKIKMNIHEIFKEIQYEL